MKFSRLLILAVALATVCGMSGRVAKADGADPKNGMGGSGSCAFFSETSLIQSFFIQNTATSTQFDCTVDFQNLTGVAIQSLTVVFPAEFATSTTCVIDSFLADGFSQPPFNTATQNANTCTYSGAGTTQDNPDGPSAPGVIAAAVFNGDNGFTGGVYGMKYGYSGADYPDAVKTAGMEITLIATPVPEPATLILIGTGLTALALRRKSSKTSATRAA